MEIDAQSLPENSLQKFLKSDQMAEGMPLTKLLLFISMMNFFLNQTILNEMIKYVHQVESYIIFRWWKPFSHVTLLFSEQIAGLLHPPILKFSCDQKKWMSEKGRFGIAKLDIFECQFYGR